MSRLDHVSSKSRASHLLAALLVGGSVLALAGCDQTVGPASTAGECGIFRDPGFAVQGKRTKDSRWIAKTQESGIKVCGWARPKAEIVDAQ